LANDPGYPDNLLELDQLNSLNGGRPDGQMDSDQLKFINGLLRKVAEKILSHVRVPWSVQAPITQEACVPGDVLAMDLSRDAFDASGQTIPYVGKYSTIVNAIGMAVAIGVAVDTVGVGGRPRIAGMGPIEARYTGLAPGQVSGGTQLAVDLTTNKLRAWTAGDEVVAYGTPKGCVLFLGAARPG
jgi:hypothetical protein